MALKNSNSLTRLNSNFIRYLYQEGVRKGVHKSPGFYQTLLDFINTPEGQTALSKFNQINPHRFGMGTDTVKSLLKRPFHNEH